MTSADLGVRCAEAAEAAGEHLPGTAPQAAAWLLIEHCGPFGRQALSDPWLAQPLGDRLASWGTLGVKALVARCTGRHAVAAARGKPRRVWVAHAATGRMVTTTLTDLDAIGELDPSALAVGTLPPWPAHGDPTLFVCTNGRRDQCCAMRGRRVVTNNNDPALWECSHLGGHRFAATGVLLPWGYVVGRLHHPGDAARILATARLGGLATEFLRGRSCYSPAEQAAEIAVRQAGNLTSIHQLLAPCEDTPPSHARNTTLVRVPAPDGRVWQVELTAHTATDSIASCGASPVPQVNLRVTRLTVQAPAAPKPSAAC